MVWDSESISKYKEILDQYEVKRKFEIFNNTDFTSSENAVKEFTYIMNETLQKVFPRSKYKRKNGQFKKRENFSYTCQVAKRAFKRRP